MLHTPVQKANRITNEIILIDTVLTLGIINMNPAVVYLLPEGITVEMLLPYYSPHILIAFSKDIEVKRFIPVFGPGLSDVSLSFVTTGPPKMMLGTK
jgi:hypothetical protein